MERDADNEGRARWVAGLRSVGLLSPEQLTEVHRKALARARARLFFWDLGSRAFLFLIPLGAALNLVSVRHEAIAWPLLVAVVGTLSLGRSVRALLARSRVLRRTAAALPTQPTVERFVGRVSQTTYTSWIKLAGERGRLVGKRQELCVDVDPASGAVLALNHQLPRGHRYTQVQTTSSRLSGTPQGVVRELCYPERIELQDLARHESVWRSIWPVAVLTFPSLVAMAKGDTRALTLYGGFWLAAVLCVTAADHYRRVQRKRFVEAARRQPAVIGGTRKDGVAVELLLPDKILWTVGDRPAEERLRPRSQRLATLTSRPILLEDAGADTPATF
jgi:hypothetical protein